MNRIVAVAAGRILTGIVFAVLAAGCATSPFDTGDRTIASLGPADALRQPARVGAEVIWGGRIVGIVNSAEHTELEVLALPLRSGHRPRRDAEGGIRFVVRVPGFLEPMNYSPGRYVTALGRYVGIESRSIGSFEVDHPVLESRQLELWPVVPNSRNTRFSLGLGVRL